IHVEGERVDDLLAGSQGLLVLALIVIVARHGCSKGVAGRRFGSKVFNNKLHADSSALRRSSCLIKGSGVSVYVSGADYAHAKVNIPVRVGLTRNTDDGASVIGRGGRIDWIGGSRRVGRCG